MKHRLARLALLGGIAIAVSAPMTATSNAALCNSPRTVGLCNTLNAVCGALGSVDPALACAVS
ncbi:MAG TPA: hypothetical protein VFQ85_04350 [Mycobacteriales bacterium]|jgi:hypothetical protein|nr:hypothetical protein [Mycobacteriales bacterium]